MGVILSGLVVIWTGWSGIDVFVTLLFTSYIMYTALGLVKQSSDILLQVAPEHLSAVAITADLERIEGVLSAHCTHAWQLTVSRPVVTVHLVVPAYAQVGLRVLRDARAMLVQRYGVHHTTIQIEADSLQCDRICGSAKGGWGSVPG